MYYRLNVPRVLIATKTRLSTWIIYSAGTVKADLENKQAGQQRCKEDTRNKPYNTVWPVWYSRPKPHFLGEYYVYPQSIIGR